MVFKALEPFPCLGLVVGMEERGSAAGEELDFYISPLVSGAEQAVGSASDALRVR